MQVDKHPRVGFSGQFIVGEERSACLPNPRKVLRRIVHIVHHTGEPFICRAREVAVCCGQESHYQ